MKRSKFISLFTCLALCVAMMASSGLLSGCGAKVESLSLNTNGATTEFEVGDTFSAAGLKVTATLSDKKTESVELKDCKISSPNMEVAGEKDVVVTYKEVKASYKITVKEKKPPLAWEEDFKIDPSGSEKVFELEAVDAALDGSDRLGPADVDPENAIGGMIYGDKVIFMIKSEAAGKAKLFINFDHSSHGNSPVKNLIKFTVNNNEVATEAEFSAGEEGHAHTAWKCYQQTLIGEVDVVAGQNTIVLEFLGNGSNLNKIILDFSNGEPQPPAVLTGITSASAPSQFFLEDRFFSDGLVVTAQYSDSSSAPVALKDCEITAPDMSTAGEKTVTVKYAGKETTYKITVKAERRFKAAPTEEVKRFDFSAIYAQLDSSIKVDMDNNEVGGIAAANAPKIVFKFNSTVAQEAKLLLICDDNFKGNYVSSCMSAKLGENTIDLTDLKFAEPALGHEHTAWHCFHDTKLGKIQLSEGTNTITLQFSADFTNVRGIAIDFTADPAEPEPVPYRFEAENATLSNCMVEYKAGVGASGDMLLGDMGTVGAKAEFKVYAANAVAVNLIIKFASGSPAVLGNIFGIKIINAEGENTLDLKNVNVSSGSGVAWYQWTAAKISNVALVQGLNKIVVSNAGAGSNFDCIEIESPDVELKETAEGETAFKFDSSKCTYGAEVAPAEGHEGWLSGIAQDSVLTYVVHSDAKVTADLSIFFDHSGLSKPMASTVFEIKINGKVHETQAQIAYCGACPQSNFHAISCKLGEIEIDGDTTITITFKTAVSNFNMISLATTGTLTAVAAA